MKEILSLIKSAKSLVIIPSYRLDGDCMGSALGLKAILEAQNKKITVVYSCSTAGRFSFLPGAGQVVFKDLFEVDFSPFDLAIFLDGPDLNQFYDFDKHRGQELKLPASLKTVCIDHHESEKPFAKANFLDPKASSASELICRLFGPKYSKEAALCLFVGISTDTGHFKYDNTKSATLKCVADLVETGLQVAQIYDRLYNTKNYKAIKFAGILVSRIKINTEYKYAYYCFDRNEALKDGLTIDEADEASHAARDQNMMSIDGIIFAFVLKDEGGGAIKGSLRVRERGVLDMVKLARILSPEKGGGHQSSAGFSLFGKTLSEAEKYVQKMIEKNYNEIKIT